MSRDELLKDPWVRLVRAGAKGQGIRLTAEDVLMLMSDGAILTCAEAFCDDNGFSLNLHTGALEQKP